MGSKWLQRALSLVFATVGVGGVGGNHRPKGGQAPAVFPPVPLEALVSTFPKPSLHSFSVAALWQWLHCALG